MSLSTYQLNPSIAVSDMARAQEFYEGKLRLRVVQTGADGSRVYGSRAASSRGRSAIESIVAVGSMPAA
jgi:catechol 2,3-dioxygenase-like lactoylglutathione lyase family enzyme